MNKAQLYLHNRLEAQKKRTGKVRAIVLKGRQQGVSTYIGARFYHKTITNPGTLTFIFAHDSAASDSLYGMVQGYYDLSDETIRPVIGSRNHKELLFPTLRSGYKVGTAGTSGLGRSKTFQLVHWSETAYSPNAAEHAAGILQTVADEAGTEIILESTANGEGDYFHLSAMQAISGIGDFELIFIPWYWQDEYRRPLDADFKLSQSSQDGSLSEQEYFDLFSKDGLTYEHLNWRRGKIASFNGDETRFKHEYPFTPEEAFETSSDESYIKPSLIRAARNTPQVASNAPLVFGVDPAALGGDKFVVCHRKGRNVTRMDVYRPGYPAELARQLANDIRKYQPMRVNIDCGGLGIAVYGELMDLGFGNIINKIDFGGRSITPEKSYNRTSDMFIAAREWLEDTPCSFQCDEESAAAIQAELASRQYKYHNNSQLRMEPKENVKKRLKRSPDKSDAFLLTFAEIIAQTDAYQNNSWQPIQMNIESWSPF